ncbi:MAG: helix-turn-helix domain-containing protein [Lactobacillaceae bacterium]|jgi:Rgg/GadR/MutR family transcriptional activator|nr:helix-turn-helix domain-containing protein [Lactobacillaceae bacterium]
MTEVYIGNIFKTIRKKRGLTISDAAGTDVDRSFISKFENGRSDISMSRLILILKNIGMTLSEFSEQISRDKNDLVPLLTKIGEAFYQEKYDWLRELRSIQQTFWIQTHNKVYKLNVILISSILTSVDNKEIKQEDIGFIVDYLFDVGEWQKYEYQLFSKIINVLPVRVIDQYLNIAIKKYPTIDSSIQISVIKALENRIVLSLEEDIDDGKYWYQKLLSLDMPEGEAYLVIKRRLLFGMLDIKNSQNKENGIHLVQSEIKLLNQIGFHKMADYHKKTISVVC